MSAFAVPAAHPARRQRPALGLDRPLVPRWSSKRQVLFHRGRPLVTFRKHLLSATERVCLSEQRTPGVVGQPAPETSWMQRAARALMLGLATVNIWTPLLRGISLGAGLQVLLGAPAVSVAKTPHARYSRKTLSEKLAQVPVFAVTNESGQPFLAAMERGLQVGLIFFDPDDAIKMLEDLKRSSGKEAEDARIFIMGLDRAFEMVKSKPQPSGLRGPRGDELKMVFRFYPNQQQLEYARTVAKKTKQPTVRGVPCFVAKGLTLRKGKEFVIPIFLDKRDLDEAWNRLRQELAELPKQPEIEVGDLIEVILRLEEAAKNPKSLNETELQDLRRVAFFPSSKSVEFMKRESAKQFKGTARMHSTP
jgi:hypothetical protein